MRRAVDRWDLLRRWYKKVRTGRRNSCWMKKRVAWPGVSQEVICFAAGSVQELQKKRMPTVLRGEKIEKKKNGKEI